MLTQPPIFCVMGIKYWPKCSEALLLGSEVRLILLVGKSVGSS